ncbi:MAG: hypothetical protein KAY37_04810 [Phycisphaerae bacterium]|nr:hypothetical protein [Phycisphaerae bacterium]
MSIKYALFENNITTDPDDYAAMVQISGSADGDDLVQDIIDQGSTVTKPDILAVTAALPALGGTAVSAVSDGKAHCSQSSGTQRVEQGQRVTPIADLGLRIADFREAKAAA